MNNRAYFMNVLCVVGWNEKDNVLIFQPQYDMASPQSVMQHFLALISNLSDGALTIGTSPVFTLCFFCVLNICLCFYVASYVLHCTPYVPNCTPYVF